MPNDDILTDDYLAEVLAKEAADCSLEYSSVGLEAFRAEKKFVGRLSYSENTDRHNANLLAKETAESQARLKALEETEERQKRKSAAPQDVRRRQMGDILSILGGRKADTKVASSRRSTDATSKRYSTSTSSRRRHRDGRSASPDQNDSKRRRRQEEREPDVEDRESQRKRSSHRGPKDPCPQKTEAATAATDLAHHLSEGWRRLQKRAAPDKGRPRTQTAEDRMSKYHRTSRDKSPAHGNAHNHGPSSDLASERPERERRHGGGRLKSQNSRHALKDETLSDSDPLDDIIGPAPPPPIRTRGRGFQTGSSAMDKHFDASYDPKADVEMDETTGNWEEAVETFRDRHKWQQSQEQRLRAAGFGDEEIDKWKRGGERNEADVKWTKAGEKREWDRGKDGELKGLFSEDN
ncbi:conserved hypothetical protein [Verticillium alfalfae VaMs.102]|uniref:Pre-mRNA-splicing factor 38B n=1 Tax=Verticillium alfalfae (strain VaMs.102 / ATCC MYA-4576 / FGSC 10136) TaxID=526221 RepID=C9SC48_VERA1|nr:conserved hypothetical protein [Verticillium alfalfae VaMs.102]EEY15932.1 conserved hypothetical protein [Verticillium alfalfae VaMs.102]